MDVNTVMERPELWEMIFTVIAFLFVLIKGTEHYQNFRHRAENSKYRKALHAIEQAVNDTYETYVRDVRERSADGKLTTAERQAARSMAVRKAREYGREIGVEVYDVFTTIGLQAEVQRVVDDKKKIRPNAGTLVKIEEVSAEEVQGPETEV